MVLSSDADDAAPRQLHERSSAARQSSSTALSAVKTSIIDGRQPVLAGQTIDPIDREGFLADQAAWHEALRGYLDAVRAFNTRSMATPRTSGPAREASPMAHVTQLVPESQTTTRGELTRRQYEVAALIARGYTNVQIAEALTVTPGTAGNHVAHIMRRLKCRSRTQVAMWMVKQGLLADTSMEPS